MLPSIHFQCEKSNGKADEENGYEWLLWLFELGKETESVDSVRFVLELSVCVDNIQDKGLGDEGGMDVCYILNMDGSREKESGGEKKKDKEERLSRGWQKERDTLLAGV